ncbi:MAG: peptidase [Alcanivoracaceae bacterium]|nr:peptidase [Alcanivoracaceae bacterium]MCG8437898.1 PepSY domain-containing protein [Pseudomonadales bacterium]MED5432426.1 PepSY domain-containing protein [Pseudomonadota bacterium]MEE2869955.1 PepSY domain-containing protein [Pseudomonadota bacterium]|tara:strand:+ start:3928 stop:4236 length:309 start_codon:yes stop_codon:yes gene_type:complete
MNTTAKLMIATLMGLTASTAVLADDVPHNQVQSLVKEGTILSLDKLDKVATDKHPQAKITDTDLEHEYGRYIYQVELRDAQGQEWDLDIDATSGELLGEERD